jgi:hypothetical protein
MNAQDINKKRETSSILMSLAQSTGTWLNGSLQPQHYYVLMQIKDPDGKIVTQVALTYEQMARTLLYSGPVDCTLQRYRNETGKLVEEVVPLPKTVKERMHDRLEDVNSSLTKRLEDVKKDLYLMVNGHTKPGKTNLEELMKEIDTIQAHFKSNQTYVAQETEKELAEMQSNMTGQLGLLLQTQAGLQLPGQTLTKLLPVSDGPLLLGEPIEPVIESYELKNRQEIPIDDMTAMEVVDKLQKRLSAIEKKIPHTSAEETILYFASASLTSKGKISILYISYQSPSVIELDLAKKYLKFLQSIKTASEFKQHSHFDVKKNNS